MSDIIYFELNNWFAGRDYPNAEPFITWCGDDEHLYFSDKDWVKKNKLCVVETIIDMSVNWCITATKEWVEKNCPKLLTNESTTVTMVTTSKDGENRNEETYSYGDFLRVPDENGEIRGRFGCYFLEYKPENFGIKFDDEYSL